MHAGTNANVFATIYGENGDSGERKLQKSEKHLDKFERNQVRTSLQIIEIRITDSKNNKKRWSLLDLTEINLTGPLGRTVSNL